MIFHFDKVNFILDEIIMAGMVLETNINNIMTAVHEQERLASASLTTSSVQHGAGSAAASDYTSYFSNLTSSLTSGGK